MIETLRSMGDCLIRIRIADRETERYVAMTIGDREADAPPGRQPDYTLRISGGYGRRTDSPNDDAGPVAIEAAKQGLTFTRMDYRVVMSPDRREADIRFCDYFALRTALLNWLSTVLAEQGDGLLIHSSCAAQNGEAYVFTGYSGAGKTTVASLSRPRPLLADETALLRVPESGRPLVYDSPFRNDFKEPAGIGPVPLRAIYVLEQSARVRARRLARSEALLALFDKVVYWKHDPRQTTRLIRRCAALVERVPVYVLEFQKNNGFWEVIS